LTGWIPLLASNANIRNDSTRVYFFVLPCCFHDLTGARNPFGVTIPLYSTGGRYESYLAWVEQLGKDAGFNVDREWLRIPSTKNCALIGRGFQVDDETRDFVAECMKSRFVARLSDNEKNRLQLERKQARLNMPSQVVEDDGESAVDFIHEFGCLDLTE
jgi:hypothetical protein